MDRSCGSDVALSPTALTLGTRWLHQRALPMTHEAFDD
jgi:hypothetical protein